MKFAKSFCLTLILFTVTMPAMANVRAEDRAENISSPGTSCEQAVRMDSKDAESLLKAEHQWIREQHGSYKYTRFERAYCGSTPVDIIHAVTNKGPQAFYFDVSLFPTFF